MASHRPMTSSSPATSRMTMTTTTSRRALPHNNGSRGRVPPRRPRLAHHCRLSRCLPPPAADPFQHCYRSFCQWPSPRLQRNSAVLRHP
ncbi:Os12g0532850 [Oryza sativa Japonica Group]|uniref:Os12g0532850 protein n=1 Tax=Oryza sativa subsp. japonica TaxID=39947 RepID=A0A0P0YB91_ORYSJ|nr:Os12g0532850 [Oryza sativa Japonica Group]